MLDTTKCSVNISHCYDTVKSKLIALASGELLLPHPPCISALQPIAYDFCLDDSRLPIASQTHTLCPVSEVLCVLLRISFTHSLFEFHGQRSLATAHRVAKSWTQLKRLSMHAAFLVYLIELLAIFWNQIHKSPCSESLPSSSSVEGFPFSSVQSLYLACISMLHLHTVLNLVVNIVTCTTEGSSMLSLCRVLCVFSPS